MRAITATGLPRAHSRPGLPEREWGEGTSRDRSPSNSGRTHVYGGKPRCGSKEPIQFEIQRGEPLSLGLFMIESCLSTPSGLAGCGHGFDGEFDPGSGRTLAACLTHASRAGSIQ